MAAPPLTTVALGADVAAALEALPPVPGVGQFLGPEGQNLLLGRAANLRRWAATHLGAGPPARKGSRPPTNLRPVARSVAYATTTSGFHQRLLFERLMVRYVPVAARRDLKPPAWLHLDPTERFPRVTVRPAAANRANLFGPFRDRRAAERAAKALHKLFPLRPCDFVFEPDPALALGLGCVYAQVRSCAAPCLGRIAEEAYRALAGEAAAFLAEPGARPADATAWAPGWVAAAGGRGVVADRRPEGLELYPVAGGAVCEDGAVATSLEGLEGAFARLRWPEAASRADDTPWLAAWLASPRRTGAYATVGTADPAAVVRRLCEALGLAPVA
ncbi:MAG: hypothetical protein HY317_06105 [Acidobacteria bacterium]|nr:hypothetical protein [Acidobacteriota bacterium]